MGQLIVGSRFPGSRALRKNRTSACFGATRLRTRVAPFRSVQKALLPMPSRERRLLDRPFAFVAVGFRAWPRCPFMGAFAASRFTSFPVMLRNVCSVWISTLELSKRDLVLE